MFTPPHRIVFALSLALLATACGGGSGVCVGTGGVLLSPVCKNGWSQSECQDFQNTGVNGATWTYQADVSCPDLGYTQQCSDGSYRRSGAC